MTVIRPASGSEPYLQNIFNVELLRLSSMPRIQLSMIFIACKGTDINSTCYLLRYNSSNFNYTALRVLFHHFIIGRLGREPTTSLLQRLRASIVTSWRLLWSPRFFLQALRFWRWWWRWVLQWRRCAILRPFLFLLCGIRWLIELVRNNFPRVPRVNCSVEDVSKCLRYLIRCIEPIRLPQNFKSSDDFHIRIGDMIINRYRWTSVVVESTPSNALRASENVSSPYVSHFLSHLDLKLEISFRTQTLRNFLFVVVLKNGVI